MLLVLGEVTLTHATEHAKLATRQMVVGRFAPWFWIGVLSMATTVVICILGIVGPWLDPIIAGTVLLGLFAHEHAYVQAGQSVPLA